MSSRVLGFVLIGVSLVLLGSATVTSADWVYTENWATPGAQLSSTVNNTPGAADGSTVVVTGFNSYAPYMYFAFDNNPAGTYASDGYTASVANNVLTMHGSNRSDAYPYIFGIARASEMLPSATPSQPTATYFDLSKGPLTVTALVSANGNGNGGSLLFGFGGANIWAGVTDALQISPDSGTADILLPGGAVTGSFSGLPSNLTNVSLKATAKITDQSVVWSLSSADGLTNYGSETVTQSPTATLLFGLNFGPYCGYNTVANFGAFSVQQTAVPEPSALVLLATGLIGLLAYAWRKRR